MSHAKTTRAAASGRGFIPLFWRLFIPNASVLLAASIVLTIEPANGRIAALAGGLLLMLTVNLLLMRRTIAPLARLIALMEEIDPLAPGRRLPPGPAESEVTALAESFNRMLERLENERRESGRRALAAQESERRRVAAELHDQIGQELTALLIRLERLRRHASADEHDELAAAADTARQTLEDVRTLAQRLRPPVLDELGLVPALRNLCDRMSSASGLTVQRTLPAELPELSEEAELVIYRVVQESLTNVARHAQATSASVTLAVEDGHVQLVVTDDGVGFGPGRATGGGGGVRSMRERALAIGAQLQLSGANGRGARVALRVPVMSAEG